jgi:hypothetical protein
MGAGGIGAKGLKYSQKYDVGEQDVCLWGHKVNVYGSKVLDC